MENRQDFDSVNMFIFLYTWKKPIMIVTIAAAIGSVIFSAPLFITPKFQSSVIFFPAHSTSISKSLIAENFGGKKDILEFGEETEAEQALQILNSYKIRNKIIEKHDLMNHYEIDSDSDYPLTKLYEEYEDNFRFKRTEFMSVRIDVLDTDPRKAADMANDVAALLDSSMNHIQSERAVQGLKIVEQEYFGLQKYLKTLDDSMKTLMSLGVLDYESQSEMLNQQYAIVISQGNKTAQKMLEEKLKILSDYGSAYIAIRDERMYESEHLSQIKSKYMEAKVDAEQNMSRKFIVDNAIPAEKKSYPIRWLIVAVSTLSALILCVVVILVAENFRRISENKN